MPFNRGGWPFRNPPNVRFRVNKNSPQFDGLLGWWLFLAGRGDRIPDLLGRGQHGTLTNGPTWSIGGKRGRGVEFEGGAGNDAISIANPGNIDPSYSSLTLSFWVRWDGADGNNHFLIGKRDGWPNVRWQFSYNDTASNMVLNNGSATLHFVGIAPTVGKVQHIVVTANGTNTYLYIDGDLKSTQGVITAMGTASDPIVIGNNVGMGIAWNGAIYEARVQDKFLNAEDVWEQYSNPWELCAPEVPFKISVLAPSIGGITVTPTAATSIVDSVAPTTILGSLLITPTIANVIADTITPTVQLSSLSLTPTLAGAITETVAPVIELGAMSVTPVTSSAIADVTNPAVELGSLVITPGVADAIVDVVNPTVIGGGLNITPDFASTITEAVAPTVGLGSISTTPIFASSIVDVVNPTVLAGGAIVTPVVATTIADVVNPTVILGSVSVTPVFASAIAGVINPTVIGGIGLGLESKLDISTGLIL